MSEPERESLPALELRAPLEGWSTPLEEVPDGAFAGRMLGDGLAVDPTAGALHAPCDGTVIALAASRHAVTVRAPNGAEILLHVGIDTVGLGGAGFASHVQPGAAVRAGELLLSFDLDLLAQRARSLITPVVVANGADFTIVRRRLGCALRVGDPLCVLAAAGSQSCGARDPRPQLARRVAVQLEHGIHARPAALLARLCRTFAADVSLHAHGRCADARSTVALLALGVRHGEQVEVRASGADAEAAIDAVAAAMRAPQPPARLPSRPAGAAPADGTEPSAAALGPGSVLHGVVAVPGHAIGRAARLQRPEIAISETAADSATEHRELEAARSRVRAELQRLPATAPGPAREIMSAHLELLDDPTLTRAAAAAIDRGASAALAWRQALRSAAAELARSDDPRIAERTADLLDLEMRVLLALGGRAAGEAGSLPERAIVLAEDLLPSQLLGLEAGRLAGICLAGGGATSHAALLAAALDVPMLVRAGPAVLRVAADSPLVLDAERGVLHVDPGLAALEAAERTLAARAAERAAERLAAQRECRTADGTRIEIFANVGSVAEAHAAVACGAEGCGLLRTEFLFLDRESAPEEAEQTAQYQRIAAAFGGHPLVIRTLDAGADKPIPYLALPAEPNPALGLRGIRTSLWQPDLLTVQLRAILAVRPLEACRILVPMVTDPAEMRAVRARLEELRRTLGCETPVPLGAMIETPAAAVAADRIAREADFLSIGTNDLAQYTLAMDRAHAELAGRLDALHPAVLRLIAGTAAAARTHGRPLAVCGGLASDPIAAPILVGFGVSELSAAATAVPRIKASVRRFTLEECRALARAALEQESAEAVRALAAQSAAERSRTAPVHG